MNIFNEPTRYPENGDKFFIEQGNPDEIAWLNKSFQDFGTYADSYQNAALDLLDNALSNKELRDFNIYPSVFLIRHYIELRLKELIQGLNYCNNQNRDFPKHHDIKILWNEFKKSYKAIGEDDKDSRFVIIDGLIMEMSNNDPISMSFRYPVDKSGVPTQKLEYINLKNLKEVFIRVCFVFDAVAMQIAHYVETTEDMTEDIMGAEDMMREFYEDYW